MFGHQVITFWTTIYLLSNHLHVTRASTTRKQCQKNVQIWYCTDDKYCGHTYQSCVNTFGPIDTSVLITLIIFGILTLGIAIVSIYYLCIRRKQLPTVHTTARVQSTTMGRRTHQEIISYVDSNTSNSIQIPIMESAPPPYEQNHRENFATESENV